MLEKKPEEEEKIPPVPVKKRNACVHNKAIECPIKWQEGDILECFICISGLSLKNYELFYNSLLKSSIPFEKVGVVMACFKRYLLLGSIFKKLVKSVDPNTKMLKDKKKKVKEKGVPKGELVRKYIA